jgi:hypothetical protein
MERCKQQMKQLFQDKKEAITKYIEDKKLNLKNEAHLIDLVKYYNTL